VRVLRSLGRSSRRGGAGLWPCLRRYANGCVRAAMHAPRSHTRLYPLRHSCAFPTMADDESARSTASLSEAALRRP
jgi:hypothetical protein